MLLWLSGDADTIPVLSLQNVISDLRHNSNCKTKHAQQTTQFSLAKPEAKSTILQCMEKKTLETLLMHQPETNTLFITGKSLI